MVSNVFNLCTAQNYGGGGVYACQISSCALISGCDFQMCKASYDGGGLRLDNFGVSGSGCIGEEDGEGGSSCVFECSFTSCSLNTNWGGGMYCRTVPAAFKMRSIQFISCSAMGYGGDNPFYECYTTNTDEKRACYGHDYSSLTGWTLQDTEKKDWLKIGILNRFVASRGGSAEEFCGANESYACRTIGIAVEKSVIQVSLSVTLIEGDHASEATTIDIWTKKISVIGKGRTESSIETGALSSSSSSFSSSSTHSFFFLQFFLRKKVIQQLRFIS
ncbi:uncharacterized protein MONOS_16345 [Monocercomonoides exilis]|uniref:uncharacterized protein n=1 Tax=Monocercomonoides exilis TaxID=2049356 RepID=UPI00355A170B|nr:hypothetical protein MONOS_16345 [Monocercomonoides exilis]|eukprot:MONOS_16345.1-p1 / transcript=MONOS_16345.1 / gene=MONOS_16345 / organism=Monocercomonoides_exilis_PA203 / gene_product=unspecified product / transcript_product=unspecified product / location=Mono_scaffold01663:3678-4652(-) / protein_length=275 / sequence_SO=supercontig / SO=protein_coding / is_pseudo=false